MSKYIGEDFETYGSLKHSHIRRLRWIYRWECIKDFFKLRQR